ncbi:hypothetical protein CEXT_338821 [Caerostris extrusa]|uniref:Uncharacterized protein n=1 Tax=Caerostris extrusa TaxID=172846 RepID=A0AAV4UVA6_CAEEX|nr:hypothetical protein CEXT_338821 [Caerostris extrusa]
MEIRNALNDISAAFQSDPNEKTVKECTIVFWEDTRVTRPKCVSLALSIMTVYAFFIYKLQFPDPRRPSWMKIANAGAWAAKKEPSLCPSTQECIPEFKRCDGVRDCQDDEIDCPTRITDTCEMISSNFETFDGLSYQYDICDHVLMQEKTLKSFIRSAFTKPVLPKTLMLVKGICTLKWTASRLK